MRIQRAIVWTVFPSVTSEGTPVVMFLPEALRGLQTRLIPRQTREKPSHVPSPTTTAIRLIGSKSSLGHRRRSRPRSLIMHSLLHSTQSPPLLRMSRSPPTRSVAKLPLFLSFWTAPRPVLCSRASPVPLRHSSFFYNLYDYVLQSFALLSCADPTFSFGESIPPPISPLYHNTSHDSSPERLRAPTLSSNQKRLSHPNVSAVV